MRKIYIPDKLSMRADAVVIGGGIIGTATAYWLSKFGLKTVLVESREGLSTFTTAASAECFRAQFTEPELAAIAKESIEIFENFAEFTGLSDCSINIRQHGYLFITDEEKMIPDLKAAVEQQHKNGVGDTVFLTGEEVVKKFPFISDMRGRSDFPAERRMAFLPRVDPGFRQSINGGIPYQDQSDRYSNGLTGCQGG